MDAEELLKDKTFLDWYKKSDPEAILLWENRRKASMKLRNLMDEAVIILQLEALKDNEPTDEKVGIERMRLMSAIEEEDLRVVPLKRKLWLPWVAASVVLGLVSLFYFNSFNKQSLEYITAGNEIREIVLPDSSVVSLNQNSHLKMLTRWSGKDSLREVWLDGEAYFSVRRKANGSKFIVHTGDLKVEVLGTTFNIKKQSEKTTVVLETGKVQVFSESKPDDKILMKPGELAEFTSGSLTHKAVNTEVFTAWKEGKIVFENVTIHEIATRLRENYGLEVDYSALRDTNFQFNGTYPADDINVLLSALSKAYSWQIDQQGTKVVLKNMPLE